MNSLGQQFTDIMEVKMESLPLDRIAEVYVDKTLSDTRQGVNPAGDSFAEFAPSTAQKKGRSNPVTMRDRDLSIEGLDYQLTDEVASLFFPTKGDVFDMHQSGEARGGKIRQVFPEEEHYSSASMQGSFEQVGEIVGEHFNG